MLGPTEGGREVRCEIQRYLLLSMRLQISIQGVILSSVILLKLDLRSYVCERLAPSGL